MLGFKMEITNRVLRQKNDIKIIEGGEREKDE